MTQKTIERLFPCDTSMVVVIDDRADVWQYSPNLVKVHPCKFVIAVIVRRLLSILVTNLPSHNVQMNTLSEQETLMQAIYLNRRAP